MAACELKREHATRYCLFAIDSTSDIAMLPTTTRVGSGDLILSTTCCMGSLAITAEGKTYRLNGNDEWEYYSSSSGGGGGGSDEDVVDITDAQIEDLFK